MNDGIILWEAHRGGGGGFEMPESCHLSFEYGWLLGGRPDADVNMTKDGVIVSLHDPTLDRVVRDLPEEFKGVPINELTYEQVRSCDVGWEEYPSQHIPKMSELLEVLRNDKSRNMIIDYKRVELELLAQMIREYGVGSQITFAFRDREVCRAMKRLVPEIRTKNWLGGSAQNIMDQFEVLKQEDFAGITEVQLHLNDVAEEDRKDGWRYALTPDFIRYALAVTKEKDVLLQTLPWQFEREDLVKILDLGVRSFAVDFPNKFTKICAEYFSAARYC